jgi:large subunit ribosomal protein L4
MSTVDVWDPAAGKIGTAELPDAVFGVPANIPLLHQVVVAQLAAARQGTHATRTRGMVRGGGRKPYRQKGTGRARQGSTRAPQFKGGGVVHGPQPRDYSQRTPKKMKAAALRGALSDRARHGRIHVVRDFVAGATPATRAAARFVAQLTERPRVLVVINRDQEVGLLSVRNLPQVHLLTPDQLNTYDVVVSDDVIFTWAALADFLASPKSGLDPLGEAVLAARAGAAKAAEDAAVAQAGADDAAADAAAEDAAADAAADDAAADAAADEADAVEETEDGVTEAADDATDDDTLDDAEAEGTASGADAASTDIEEAR